MRHNIASNHSKLKKKKSEQEKEGEEESGARTWNVLIDLLIWVNLTTLEVKINSLLAADTLWAPWRWTEWRWNFLSLHMIAKRTTWQKWSNVLNRWAASALRLAVVLLFSVYLAVLQSCALSEGHLSEIISQKWHRHNGNPLVASKRSQSAVWRLIGG